MIAPQAKPWVHDLPVYVPGKAKLDGFENPARLAANEGPLGPSEAAMEAYRALAPQLHRYPDGGAQALRGSIRDRYGLDADRLIFGVGSDEILTLVARAYLGPGDEAVYSEHGFLMYPIVTQSVGATPVMAPEAARRTDVDAILDAVTERTRVVFLANPNNPTGTYATASELERLHQGLRGDILLVLDAAYAEYVREADYDPGTALVENSGNVLMTRIFSKIHALAGLRLGLGYGPAAVIESLNRLRDPFNINAPAAAAGAASVEDTGFIERSVAHNEQWRGWLAGQLGQLGLGMTDSVTNFLLVDFAPWAARLGCDGPGAAERAQRHLQENGILVRQMGAYNLPSCLRISIGLEHEVRAVVDHLSVLAEGSQ